MKYFSEIVNKNFDTIEELEKAEKNFNSEVADKIPVKEKPVENKRKELAKKVEDAETLVADKVNEIKIAKENCAKLLEQAKKHLSEYIETVNKECNNILNPAKDALTKAQDERYKAIREYNKEFGTYRKYYTDKDAINEFSRVMDSMWSPFTIFDNFFKGLL